MDYSYIRLQKVTLEQFPNSQPFKSLPRASRAPVFHHICFTRESHPQLKQKLVPIVCFDIHTQIFVGFPKKLQQITNKV